MTDVGTITGIIGAITGIGGMGMGAWSVAQTQKLKSQDLRMERSRLINNIDIAIIKTKNLLEEANQSRINSLAARGKFQSGSMEKWKQNAENYKNQINSLTLQQFDILALAVKNKNMEYHIQRLHLIEQQVNLIIEGLNKSLEEDNVAREALQKAKFSA